MNNLTLRRALTIDSEFAFHVKKAAFKDYVQKASGWDEDEQRCLHEQRFSSQDYEIINLDGTDIGYMAIHVLPDSLKINQLFILPEYQGRGIGRACMLLVMEKCRRLGLKACLRVLKVNPRALAFYQRLGFIQTDENDTHNLLEWTHDTSL